MDHDTNARREIYIREAIEDDIERIVRINETTDRAGGTAERYAATLADPQRLLLVAERAGLVVGWAKTHYWDHADGPAPAGHYLGGLTVMPSSQRQGIGTSLSRRRLEWIRERADVAWYVVNAGNTASIALHRHLGFALVAKASSFHTTRFADGNGLLMRAQLPIASPNH